ncbi:MAG TPA: phosphoglycerate mutase family protein, partial [Candidatus Paceibacterota bacterium]|nr:phosphoglycerate mutase family protein [Candidatus Paceibacterota bacterium]
MKVYFIRHTDWHERLGRFSPEGKLQIERMVKSIRGMGLAGADVIVFVSPLPRAMATARVVCREIGCNSVTELPWLADDAKLEDVKSGFGFIS